MTFDEYQEHAHSTAKSANMGPMFDLLVFALWAQSEMGEVAGVIAKAAARGVALTPEQLDHLEDELGDAQWGIATVAKMVGRPLSQVVDRNVTKRDKKYGSSLRPPSKVPLVSPLPSNRPPNALTTAGAMPWVLYAILALLAMGMLAAAVWRTAAP